MNGSKVFKFAAAVSALIITPVAASGAWPTEYTPLQGLGSSGTQFICTDFAPAPTDTIEVRVKFISLPRTACIWCARKKIGTGSQTAFYYNADNTTAFRFDRAQSSVYASNVTVSACSVYEFRVDYAARTLTVNGVLTDVQLSEGDFEQTAPLAFFSSHEDGKNWNNYAKMILYSARVYDSAGNLKREYLPAKCKSDGVLGLYETQEGGFFGNGNTNSTDSFFEVGGADVVTEAVAEEDGSYIFGTNTYSASNVEWARDSEYKHPRCTNQLYDFSAMTFTPAPTLRFKGGLLADGYIPSDATIDVSELKYLALAAPNVYPEGQPVVIPAGAEFAYMPGYFTEDGGCWWLTRIDVALPRDLVLNGTWLVSETYPFSDLKGSLSGSGKIKTLNFSREIIVRGAFAFTGTIEYTTGACGTHMIINSNSVTGKIEKVKMEDYKKNDAWWYDNKYHRTYIRYDPACGHSDDPLRIEQWESHVSFYDCHDGKWWRAGNALNFWNNNRVTIDRLTGTGALHVVADTALNSTKRTNTGDAYLEISNITSTATLFLSTNVYLTVGTVSDGATFDYACESNAVTTATLDITNSCSTVAKVRARDLALLPARITGFTGDVTLTETDTKTYPVTIDFDADVANYGGCDGSGRLVAAPTAGTIDVTLKGTPKRGNYALARFTSGGELLNGWTVNAPNFYNGFSVEVVKDNTGLWLKIYKAGMILFLR